MARRRVVNARGQRVGGCAAAGGLACAWLGVLLATACDAPSKKAPPAGDAVPSVADSGAASIEALPAPEPPSAVEVHAFASASNALGFDLVAKARETHEAEGNAAFSPLSVTLAMAMLAPGARTATAAEVAATLHFTAPLARSAEIAGGVASDLARRQPGTKIANGLFGDSAYVFDSSYLARTKAAFGVSLQPLDFRGQPEAARAAINAWVAARTDDRVRDLLSSGSVGATTRLLVASAIDFSARWAFPFDERATLPGKFHRAAAAGGPATVPMMHADVDAWFAAADGAAIVDLHYAGDQAAMTFVLPDRVDGLEALEGKLDEAAYERWIAALTPQPIACALPKFAIDPAKPMLLNALLQALGMRLAFDPDKADFGGVAPPADGTQRLYLGTVLHKAAVKIDEEGTRATASTAVTALSAAPAPGVKRRAFVADHPFLFFVRDLASGAILFSGRVADPGGR